MLTATEQQVKMAAQLYEMRDKARWLLGDKYKPHMAAAVVLVRRMIGRTIEPASGTLQLSGCRRQSGAAQC